MNALHEGAHRMRLTRTLDDIDAGDLILIALKLRAANTDDVGMRLVILLLAPLTGCSLGAAVPIAVDIEVERFDVDVERAALEEEICATESTDCGFLTALDLFDDGEVGDVPRFPPLLPTALNEVDVQGWINDVRASHDLVPERALTLALPASVKSMAGETLDAIIVEDAALAFSGNTLTFDVPAFDVFLDGEHLARTEALPAGTDGRAPLSLVDGAMDMLRAALAADGAELTLSPVDDAQLELPLSDDGKLITPAGQTDIALALDLAIPLSLE